MAGFYCIWLLLFIYSQIMNLSSSHKSFVAAFRNGSLLQDSDDGALNANSARYFKQFRDVIGNFTVVWNEGKIYMLIDVVFYVVFENAVHGMTVTLLIGHSVIENNVTLTHTTAVPDWVKARVAWDTTEGAYVGTVFHKFNCSKTDSTVKLNVFGPGSQQDHLLSVSIIYITPYPMKIQFFADCEANNIATFIIAIDNSTLVTCTAVLDFGDGTSALISDFRQDLPTNLSHNIVNTSGTKWRITTVKHKYKWSGKYFAILKLPPCFELYNLSTFVNVYDSLYESVGRLDIILVGQETECQKSFDMTNTVDVYADAIYLVCFEKLPPEEVIIFVDFGDSTWSRIHLSVTRTLDLPLLHRRLFRYYKDCHLAKTAHAFTIPGRYNVSVGIVNRIGSVRKRTISVSTETIVRSFTDSVGDITLLVGGVDANDSVYVGENVTFIIRLAHFVRNSVIAVNFSDQSPLTVMRISKETILSKQNLLNNDASVSVFHQFVSHGFYSVAVQIFDGSLNNSSFLSASTGVRVLSFVETIGSASLQVLETFSHIVSRDVSFLLALQRPTPTTMVLLNFGDGSYVSNVTLSKSLDQYFRSHLEDCVGCFLAIVKHAYASAGNYSAIMTVKDGNDYMNGEVFSSVVLPAIISVQTLSAHLNKTSLFGKLLENGSVELEIRNLIELPNLTVAFDFGDTYNTSRLLFLPATQGNLDTHTYKDGNIVVRHTYLGTGPYRVLATIEDDTGAAFLLEKWIMVTSCSRPLVTVSGGSPSAQSLTVFGTHETIIMQASYDSNCTHEHAVYAKWTLYCQSEENTTNYLKYDSITNRETSLNITIPGFSLKPGNFMIHSEVILTDENGTVLASNGTSAWFSIQSQLPAMKLVSNRHTYILTDGVMLNVINTFNRKPITSDVTWFSYFCFTTPNNQRISISSRSSNASAANRTVPGNCFGRGRKPFHQAMEPSLTFPAHLLQFRSLPKAYFFHVLALDSKTHVNTSASVRIILLKGPDPNITITCVQNCDSSIDPRSFIILSIGCSNCEMETEMDISWEFLPESDHSPIQELDSEHMRTQMNGRRLLVNGAIFANSTAEDVYRFTAQVKQRDGTSASAWYSYRGAEAWNVGRNPLSAASSDNKNHSGSKTSGLWFLWMLALIVAVVVSIFLIKHYVVDRKRPEKIAPAEMNAAQTDTTPIDNRSDKDATRRGVSSKYEQITTTEQTFAELPKAATTSGKKIVVRKEKELPDRKEKEIPDRKEKEIPDRKEEEIPDRKEEEIPDRKEEEIPDRKEEEIPDRKQEEIPDRKEEEIPDRKDEDTFVRKTEDIQTPLASARELPLVVNVLDVLGNLRVPSPNSSTGSIKT